MASAAWHRPRGVAWHRLLGIGIGVAWYRRRGASHGIGCAASAFTSLRHNADGRTVRVMAGMAVLTVLFGSFAGLCPAPKAARLDQVEALSTV